jgi:glycosyltransferase involved in cell wall biosynthesis
MFPEIKLSVVIPTFNRLEILKQVLTALEYCERPQGGVEVVVVSDGSTDGTNDYLEGLRPGYRFQFDIQEHAGPARAKNRGVELANGERVLFLGDDIIPDRKFILRHISRADQNSNPEQIAVLGYTTWDRRMKVTPFLRYINEHGPQFGYSLISDPNNVPFNFFYTSNISICRNVFIRLGGFDVEFLSAAWEDIEFGYRSGKTGLRIVYEQSARAEHFHPTNPVSFLKRQESVGEGAVIFARKHPELLEWLGLSNPKEIESSLVDRARLMRLRLSDLIPGLFSEQLCKEVLEQAYSVGANRGLKRVQA